MARVIIRSEQRPYKIMTTEGEKKICMCGLSKNLPFCDESHHLTDDEKPDSLYQYDAEGHRTELEEEDDECCGHGCCGEGDACCSDEECKDCDSCCKSGECEDCGDCECDECECGECECGECECETEEKTHKQEHHHHDHHHDAESATAAKKTS